MKVNSKSILHTIHYWNRSKLHIIKSEKRGITIFKEYLNSKLALKVIVIKGKGFRLQHFNTHGEIIHSFNTFA